MALVKRKDIPCGMTFRQNDNRRVGDSDAKVAISVDDFLRRLDVRSHERLDPVSSANHLVKQRNLRRRAGSAQLVALRYAPHGGICEADQGSAACFGVELGSTR
jgi:hypothetical protein